MTEFGDDDRAMLGLAALAYRGVGDRSEVEIRRKLVPWLPTLEQAGLGRWQLVWGPAAFRAPLGLFDDSMAYVVRDLDAKHARYAVVIRGTNPVSVFDWVVGDLWVDELVAWPHGPPEDHAGAQISVSSFLGLRILQSLRSEPEPPPGIRSWFSRLRRRFRRDVSDGMALVSDALWRESDDARNLLPELDWQQVIRDPDRFDLEGRLELLADIDKLRSSWVDAIGRVHRRLDSNGSLGDVSARATLDATLGLVDVAAARDRGVGLSDFLASVVSDTPATEINVTGHSKGGALANVVGLWLADTQRHAGQWDPLGKATVSCYSFAGPTAGNAAFAAHFHAMFGTRSRRITNTLDVVPHAWDAAELRQISDLYEPGMATPAPLTALVEQLATTIAPRGYEHVEHEFDFDPGVDPHVTLFLTQVIHQHLDAYLKTVAPTLPFNAASLILDP